MIKKLILISVFIGSLFSHTALCSEGLITQRLKSAQSMLSSGENEKAFALYKEIAAEKNPLAYFSLGLFYRNGWGRVVDHKAACHWFEKSAVGGIPSGQHHTGVCLESSDPVTAAVWFQKAVEGGHHLSLCALANLYMQGKGVAKDPLKALELCYQSASQGSPLAQVWMGKFYYLGDESIRDTKKAYDWFEMAANKNRPEAYYYLAVMSEGGLLEGYFADKARLMYEQAAALKYTPAYFKTGKLYFNAKKLESTKLLSAEDLAKAYLWLSAANKRTRDSVELLESQKMLKQILTVMPKSWLPELDQKVEQHLQEHYL